MRRLLFWIHSEGLVSGFRWWRMELSQRLWSEPKLQEQSLEARREDEEWRKIMWDRL
jgi:hypothetical protein